VMVVPLYIGSRYLLDKNIEKNMLLVVPASPTPSSMEHDQLLLQLAAGPSEDAPLQITEGPSQALELQVASPLKGSSTSSSNKVMPI